MNRIIYLTFVPEYSIHRARLQDLFQDFLNRIQPSTKYEWLANLEKQKGET